MRRHLRTLLLYPPPSCGAGAPLSPGQGVMIRASILPESCDMTRMAYGESRVDTARMYYAGDLELKPGARVVADAGTAAARTYAVMRVRRYPSHQAALLSAMRSPAC